MKHTTNSGSLFVGWCVFILSSQVVLTFLLHACTVLHPSHMIHMIVFEFLLLLVRVDVTTCIISVFHLLILCQVPNSKMFVSAIDIHVH